MLMFFLLTRFVKAVFTSQKSNDFWVKLRIIKRSRTVQAQHPGRSLSICTVGESGQSWGFKRS